MNRLNNINVCVSIVLFYLCGWVETTSRGLGCTKHGDLTNKNWDRTNKNNSLIQFKTGFEPTCKEKLGVKIHFIIVLTCVSNRG